MKENPILLVAVTFVSLLILPGCGEPQIAGPPVEPENVEITGAVGEKVKKIICNASGISIEGQIVKPPYTRVKFEEILGKPSRKFKKVNDIDVWDVAGVYALGQSGGDRYVELVIAIAPQGFSFYPDSLFSGVLSVGGRPVVESTTKRELIAAGFVPDSEDQNILSKIVGGMTITAEFWAPAKVPPPNANDSGGSAEEPSLEIAPLTSPELPHLSSVGIRFPDGG